MIGNLSSYIELFAAVYLTISLDDLLLKRFWTPDYKQKMEESFKLINMPELAKKQTVEKAGSVSAIEETRSRKRGIILFCFAVLLLILVGLEEVLSFSDKNYESLGIISVAFFYSLVYVFDGRCLKTGWRVLFFAMTIPALVVISGYLLSNNVSVSSYLGSSSDNWALCARIVVVLMLLLPVLWQLFRNWIYTRYYLHYIVEQTTIKAEEYDYAENFDTKKGDKMTKVAGPYMDHVAEVISNSDQDRDITPLLNVFFEQLSTVNYVPNLIPLLQSSYWMHKKYFPSQGRLRRLKKKYESMSSARKKQTLEEFCRENGVSLPLFKEFRKEQDKQ